MTGVLLAQQRQLLHAITAADADAGALLHPAPDGGAPRLAIYRHAYRARLIAALADNHTVLQRALGDEAFAALGAAYVDACPSSRPSIRWYGDRLAEFMRTREDLVPHPALVDLARMDWALRGAFDAGDAAAIGPAALNGLPAEAFARLRFEPHPSVRLLALEWTVEPAWRALREHDPASGADEPRLPEPEARAHRLLVWRRALDTQWRSLAPLDGELLQAALDGARFEALCERALQRLGGDAARAGAAAAAALQQWLADGLFSAWSA